MVGKFKNQTVVTKLLVSFSLVIAMFTCSHIYSAFSYWQAYKLHLYRTDFVVARAGYLLEFWRSFTEFRRLQRNSFMCPAWLQESDTLMRIEYEEAMTGTHVGLHRLAAEYMHSVTTDPLFDASAVFVRVTTMREILTYLDLIYDLFKENFFVGGTDSHQIGNVPDYIITVENSLQVLRHFADQAGEEILLHIEKTLQNILLLTVGIILLVVAVAIALAFFVIKAVSNMAIEKELMLLNAMPFAIDLWDDNYTPVDCNRKTLEMFGLSGKEDYFRRFYELVPETQPCGTPSREKIQFYMEQTILEGHARFELLRFTATGEPLPTEIALVRTERRDKFVIASYSSDLREIKAAKATAADAEERAALLVEALPTACHLLDSEFNEIWCNQTAVELFAKGPGKSFVNPNPKNGEVESCHHDCQTCEFLGLDTCIARRYLIENPHVILHKDKGQEEYRRLTVEACNKALANGRYRFEVDHVALYGEVLPGEVTIIPIKYRGQNAFACYVRDMREEKRREMAEEESRAKSRFLARMSHEIRTPMNAVLGITEIQLQKEGHPPDTEDAFLRIQSSSNMLLTIINDILDLSKVEAGKMEILPETYEVASMIVDTVQLNIMRVGSKNIEFKLEVDERLPTHLIGDELRIKQILNNILSNAFKYTHEGHVTLSVGIDVEESCVESETSDKVTLIMRVQDTGQGMTQDQISRLFDFEFTRFNLRSNRVIEGSGLGMTIAYQLVNMMGGEIKAESEIDRGSVFIVRIPQKPGSDSAIGKETAESLQNFEISQKSLRKMSKMRCIPMPYGRVLVVDDVESNLHVVKGILAPYKIAVETVTGGRDAVEKIRAGEVYDIIFMDHMMPSMDGIEATKLIRELGYTHPIVALTANTIKGVSEMFYNNGFSGFVPKPIDINLFNSYLVRYIHDKQPLEVIEAANRLYADAETTDNLLDSLRESFLLDARRVVDVLDSLIQGQKLDKEGLKAFVIQTHAMKSAFFNIGRTGLSKAAFALETAGREADIAMIRASAPQFIDSLREVIKELSPEDTGQDAVDEDLDFLRGQFDIIAKACEQFDPSIANRALDKLNQKQCSKSTKEFMKNIAANLLYGDFDEAAATANRAASAMQFISDIKQGS